MLVIPKILEPLADEHCLIVHGVQNDPFAGVIDEVWEVWRGIMKNGERLKLGHICEVMRVGEVIAVNPFPASVAQWPDEVDEHIEKFFLGDPDCFEQVRGAVLGWM